MLHCIFSKSKTDSNSFDDTCWRDNFQFQPESHYFYANLLWATKNYTGAVKHYEKSLDILPESQDTFNNLRAIRCYLKFHHAAQSAVAAKQSKNQGCPSRNKGGGATGNQETESRVICKNVGVPLGAIFVGISK